MEFARSKSGHDKNQIYLIKEKDEKFVYLVNGTTRTLDMPCLLYTSPSPRDS